MQSLHHIIQELPEPFMTTVNDMGNVSELNKFLTIHTDPNKRAVIRARIQNLNHLVI